jgi:hypothetical protein
LSAVIYVEWYESFFNRQPLNGILYQLGRLPDESDDLCQGADVDRNCAIDMKDMALMAQYQG